MKPTTTKKLALSTETLVRLTSAHLESVVGGFTNIDIKLRSCAWLSCRAPR